MKTTQGLLIAAVCLTATPAWAKAPLLLGMLEEPQCYDEIVCDYGRDKACLAEKTRKVRVLFARGADGWIVLDSPDAASATIAVNPPQFFAISSASSFEKLAEWVTPSSCAWASVGVSGDSDSEATSPEGR